MLHLLFRQFQPAVSIKAVHVSQTLPRTGTHSLTDNFCGYTRDYARDAARTAQSKNLRIALLT